MNVTSAEPAVETACQALLKYSSRFADALQQVADPAVRAVGTWNIAETAVHVSQSAPYFLAAARGQAELEDRNDNAATMVRSVTGEPERDLRVLAERIPRGEQDLMAYARAAGGDPPVTPFVGLDVPQFDAGHRTGGTACARVRRSPGRQAAVDDRTRRRGTGARG